MKKRTVFCIIELVISLFLVGNELAFLMQPPMPEVYKVISAATSAGNFAFCMILFFTHCLGEKEFRIIWWWTFLCSAVFLINGTCEIVNSLTCGVIQNREVFCSGLIAWEEFFFHSVCSIALRERNSNLLSEIFFLKQ